MRKTLAMVIALGAAGLIPGCFTRDRDHNREHMMTWKRDLHKMHRDIDHSLKWHEPSNLIDREEPYQ